MTQHERGGAGVPQPPVPCCPLQSALAAASWVEARMQPPSVVTLEAEGPAMLRLAWGFIHE